MDLLMFFVVFLSNSFFRRSAFRVAF